MKTACTPHVETTMHKEVDENTMHKEVDENTVHKEVDEKEMEELVANAASAEAPLPREYREQFDRKKKKGHGKQRAQSGVKKKGQGAWQRGA